MPSRKQTEDAVKDLIVGFGVVEGLWIHAGVDPVAEILSAFKPLLEEAGMNNLYWLSWFVLFVVIPIAQVMLVYVWGGMVGILALILAFVGGIFLDTTIGILLALVGVGLGYYSFSAKHKVSFQDFIDMISSIVQKIRR